VTLLDRLIERFVDAVAEGDHRTAETLLAAVLYWASRNPEEIRR
jgi:hypothetical protein